MNIEWFSAVIDFTCKFMNKQLVYCGVFLGHGWDSITHTKLANTVVSDKRVQYARRFGQKFFLRSM